MNRRVLLAIVILLISAGRLYAGDGISYRKVGIRGVYAHVVTVDLNNSGISVSPAIARNGVGSTEGFGSMLSRLKPTVAITGTYFCTRTSIPVGHIVVDSQTVNYGKVGTAVCFTPDNRVEFKSLREFEECGVTSYPYAISAGPRLVRDGVPGVLPMTEGFRDSRLYRMARRSALGVTRNNKLLLVTVSKPIYLGKLAKIMRDLGAYNAVNLDGGSSTALQYRGRIFNHPGRRLTNLIVIYESPTGFARIKPKLAPTPIFAKTSTRS